MKRTQQLTADNLLAWKRTEAELRREFQSQEAALQKTLGKLRAELARVSDEARDNRDKCHKLHTSLTAAENNVKVNLRADNLPSLVDPTLVIIFILLPIQPSDKRQRLTL